eukprot:NODE_3501_length_2026_cov_18.735650.p1 GENE.NODE_3501_length_2026_cov_18.735650~~NODE_3501_length_2026_cov_18.735650.p1  ORF type:complete len:608 (+),score=199.81 NODE_3501_length_2026_cov_18.735650:228-1826(+)
MYLPLGLQNKDLFEMLSHLLLPGMQLSLRPAAMMAILVHLSHNAVLQPRAEGFLEALKGNWIPPVEKAEDYPEVLNTEFVRLLIRVPEFLTDTERALYTRLHRITRMRKAATLKLPVQVGFTPKKVDLTADTKRACGICGVRRSFTLMIGDHCAFCKCDAKDVLEPDGERSHYVECRACQALYAVVRTELLNVLPKCHFCREHTPVPTVQCTECKNNYVAPTESDRPEAGFVCPQCTVDPTKGSPARDAPLADLIERNTALMGFLGFKTSVRTGLFDRMSLYKLWMKHMADLEAVEQVRPQVLTWDGKPVKNVEEMLDFMLDRIQRGKLAETCMLCFEERPLHAMQSSCGRCENMACSECLRTWYGRLAPGKLYIPSEGHCAFCKRIPKAATLRPLNRLACRLIGRATLKLDASMYYGWCRTCFRIAEAMPKDCAREAPELVNFECAECAEKRLASKKLDEEALTKLSKKCPGCKAPTVKISGCNHITCSMCPVHWCWECGGEFPEDTIYEHMQDTHGGIGFGGDGDLSDQD